MPYTLMYSENINNIGKGYIYNHNKTNAKIIYIKNNDKNKVFSITFKTLPKNSTGVQHITEHCVLAGSKKYPLKEPFNQLDKCTLNTYLNAITFADKTLYPVASMNDKDFFKLLDVYLDGVFFPLIYEKKGIFLQEGWHFNGKNINGIVYNEMKGVYSSPDSLIDFKVKKNLFNVGYGCDSGGYPEEITDLSYEDFLKFHKQYYNPTNSIIYFYGDLDIEYYLDYIDKEYLSKFDKGTDYIINKSNNKIENKIIEDTYYVEDKNLQNKNYLQASFKLNFSLSQEKNIAFQVISNILTENQEAILKNALIKAGICDYVSSYIDDDMLEPVFTIQVENSNENNIYKFKKVIEDTIKNIKINEDIIISNFAPIEFYLKEDDFGYKPKGLFYNIILLKEMLYNKFDFSSLHFDNVIKNAKLLELEKLLKENILENENYTYAILKAINKKPINIKKNLEENTKYLKLYQSEKDTKENLAKIPPLSINDIERNIFEINSEVEKYKDIPIIYTLLDTKIFYTNFVFNIEDFGHDPYITLFAYLADKLGTNDMNSNDMEIKLNYIFGDYKIYSDCYNLKNNKYLPVLTFSGRILEKNLEDSIALINDIFRNINFSDKNKIICLIKELLNKLELSYLKDCNNIACRRAKSYVNKKDYYLESIKGITFYNWLKMLDLKTDLDNILKNLNRIKENLYCSSRLYIGVSGKEENYVKFLSYLEKLKFFNKKEVAKFEIENKIQNNEGFIIQSDVNYNVVVSDLKKYGFKYSGVIKILKTILDTDYIWEKIRAEGGAYGGEFSISKYGILCINSYSDPNIKNTYKNFHYISKYIKELKLDEDTLHMFKIGTINSFEKPLKNNEINEIALSRYFSGNTNEDNLKEKNEILDAKAEDIKLYFKILEKGLNNSFICTIGNKENIEQNREIFKIIKKLV